VFSSSTPFAPEQSYSKFGAYTVLNHGGDFRGSRSRAGHPRIRGDRRGRASGV